MKTLIGLTSKKLWLTGKTNVKAYKLSHLSFLVQLGKEQYSTNQYFQEGTRTKFKVNKLNPFKTNTLNLYL